MACDVSASALLPLDEFRFILGWNPWHFWGLADDTRVPVTSSCSTLIPQYAWQEADRLGRAEILEALETAQDKLRDYLGYSIAPHFDCQEIVMPRFFTDDFERRTYADATARFAALRLREGQVQALGVQLYTLIGTATRSVPAVPGDTLVFSDADGDGLQETFTITLPTTETDAERFGVYFAASDRLNGEPVGEHWRVMPVQVSISGGNVTIRGRVWTLVQPSLYEGVSAGAPLDPTDLTHFVDSLEVYTRVCDPTGTTIDTAQCKLIWETRPWPVWACCDDGLTLSPTGGNYDPAAQGYAIARAALRDGAQGLIAPAEVVYNATTGIFAQVSYGGCRPPDRVLVRYFAGQPLRHGKIEQRLRVAVARFAMAELARPLCGCETANRELARWQFDLARNAGANDEAYAISFKELENPFGTCRGHLFAWHAVQKLRLARASIG